MRDDVEKLRITHQFNDYSGNPMKSEVYLVEMGVWLDNALRDINWKWAPENSTKWQKTCVGEDESISDAIRDGLINRTVYGWNSVTPVACNFLENKRVSWVNRALGTLAHGIAAFHHNEDGSFDREMNPRRNKFAALQSLKCFITYHTQVKSMTDAQEAVAAAIVATTTLPDSSLDQKVSYF